MSRTRSTALRRLLREIGVPLLLLAALDAGFGWYVARHPKLPLPQLFGGDPLSAGKFLALRDRGLHPPTLDVLLLGMSQMMRVNGELLEAELSERTGRPVRAFNFAGPYHSLVFDQFLIRDVVAPIAKPAVVVYGVTPIALLNEVVPTAPTEARTAALPIFGVYVGSPVERLRGFAFMHSNLWRYREVIHNALEFPLGWKGNWFDDLGHAATPAGDVPLLGGRHAQVAGLAQAERKQQQRFADYDAVLRKTLLFDHLIQFAGFCRQQGIEFVLLNNPVHPLFVNMLPHEQRDYDIYLARLRQTAAQAHVRLFEPGSNGMGSPELYLDTVHQDAAGGAWLTEQLAGYLFDNHLVTAN
jgi:hypothetical protein